MNGEIVQIIPATGWFAWYKTGEGDIFCPIPAWALTRSGDVIGLSPCGRYMTDAGDATNFEGYLHKSEVPNQVNAD